MTPHSRRDQEQKPNVPYEQRRYQEAEPTGRGEAKHRGKMGRRLRLVILPSSVRPAAIIIMTTIMASIAAARSRGALLRENRHHVLAATTTTTTTAMARFRGRRRLFRFGGGSSSSTTAFALVQQQQQQQQWRRQGASAADRGVLASSTTAAAARAKRTGLFPRSLASSATAPHGEGSQTVRTATEAKTEGEDKEEEEVRVPRNFVPFPFQYREEVTLRVDSLTNLGVGVGRVDVSDREPINIDFDSGRSKRRRKKKKSKDVEEAVEGEGQQSREGRGWVIMIPSTIPGELVRVRVYRNHAGHSDADLVSILKPSPDRIAPVCDVYNTCGGCQYQHMTIDTQRIWKGEQVRQLLERVGRLDAATALPVVPPAMGTDDVYGYRSKLTPHYDAPSKNNPRDTMGPIGFKEKASRRLVDVPFCPIATPNINDRLASLREEKRTAVLMGTLKRMNRGATLLLRDDGKGYVCTDPNEYVTTTVGGLNFRFRAGNFFQNNPHVVPLMVKAVVDAAVGNNGNDDGGDAMTHLLDCYCGSGLFCLGAASKFDVCVGIEVNDRAVEEAEANAALNDITNCAFVAASAESIFESEAPVRVRSGPASPSTPDEGDGDGDSPQKATSPPLLVRDFPRDKTAVVVDPPRKGCSPEFLDQLYEYGPRRVVYMSCDPATQARDARGLVDHGYDIVSVQPFDLFPQTRHIECLVVFERRKDAKGRGGGESNAVGVI